MMTRRNALKKTALSAAVISVAALARSLKAQAGGTPSGPFKLPPIKFRIAFSPGELETRAGDLLLTLWCLKGMKDRRR